MAPRRIFSVVTSALLLLCSLTINAQEATPKPAKGHSLQLLSLHLHVAPDASSPAQGLRESSPEEIQRLEQLGGRDKLPRHNPGSDLFSGMYNEQLSAQKLCKPVSVLKHFQSDANLKSLAHANLNARYPIPPPQI